MSTSIGQSPTRLELLSRQRLETLLQLSSAFNSTIDMDALLPRILERTLAVTESEAGSIWVVEGERLRCTHAVGPAADRLRDLEQGVGEGVQGEALGGRMTVIVADALADERFAVYRNGHGEFATRSAVTIPLISGGQPLGVVQLVNDLGGKDQFDDEDVAFLESLADDAAAALRNARLFEAERRARNLKALLDVSHEIISTFDLDQMLFSIVNLADRAVPYERCVIAVWHGEELRVRAVSGEERVDRRAAPVRELERFLGWSAERTDRLVLADVKDGGGDAAQVRRLFADYVEHAAGPTLLVLPIADGEGELGRLLFEFKGPEQLDEWTHEAAALLANEAALAIRNAELYANVPFISLLEPLAQKRKALMKVPRRAWLVRAGVAAAVLALLVLVRLPLRVSAADASIFASVQQPARAGVAGVIADVLVREGDRVEAGQPIAQLRNEGLLIRLAETEGALRVAERRGLAAEANGSTAAAAAARLEAAQMREAMELLQRERAALRVTAPATGVVLTPRIEERVGGFHEAGDPVAWIGDADSAEVRLHVRQKDVTEVRPGDRVRVRVDARPDLVFTGPVRAISPLAETVQGEPAYMVRAILQDSEGVLRPGMHARARVYTRSQPVGYLIVRRPWRFLRMHLWW